MSDDTQTTLATPGLDKLVKALKAKSPTIKVGVLGQKASRENEGSSEGLNNAEVGAFAEFGNGDMARSFLRVPISDNLQKYMEKAGALDKDVLKDIVKTGDLVSWCKKIAVLAETIVQDAFSSGGFGKWKPANMKRKKNHETLVETQQLRNSVTSEVKE